MFIIPLKIKMERNLHCINNLYLTRYITEAFRALLISVHQFLGDKCSYTYFTVKVRYPNTCGQQETE